ncbi:hypothetical protein Tsp_03051 [Trichinella spiralis]|uniref:hypothetical protein n=1 Tax=Trichinella spiralis TaxID=6334 RepID=UPI0001EFB60B|nr:hypothetical protein Tsp_03051 [Trichinella spiralis]
MLNRLACGRWGIREMKGKTPQARKQRASEQCMLFLLSQAINDSFCAISILNRERAGRFPLLIFCLQYAEFIVSLFAESTVVFDFRPNLLVAIGKWRQCRWTAIEKAALRVDGAVGQFWPS